MNLRLAFGFEAIRLMLRVILSPMMPRILRVLTVRDRTFFCISKVCPQTLKAADTFQTVEQEIPT